MDTVQLHAAAARARNYFERLQAADLAQLDAIYTEDAAFKDPFNEVCGIAPIRQIFSHMFVQLEAPRFVVDCVVAQDDTAFMTWRFLFRARRMAGEQCIRGASQLQFAEDGRIRVHRDYWDAAEELYEKLPLIGGLMRWLKRRAAT